MHSLLIFGFGYTGAAFARRLLANNWGVSATARKSETVTAAEALGVVPVDPTNSTSVVAALAHANAILVTAAPDDQGCPGLRVLSAAWTAANPAAQWIGYLSSTSVYGDRGGAWTDETCIPAATSPQGARRLAAERAWSDFGIRHHLPVTAFRLAGIYGPGRSPFDKLRGGTARRVVKPGHITCRIHVDDIATALEAAMKLPRASAGAGASVGVPTATVYNLSDDEPAQSADVTKYAAELLGIEPPPLEPFEAGNVAPTARRFFQESRRISNGLARRELGWSPLYPSYREGLKAVLAVGGR